MATHSIGGHAGAWDVPAPIAEHPLAAVARGRALKKKNAFAALICGGIPAIVFGLVFPSSTSRMVIGFVIGLLWSNAFEYAYHRWLLHLPGSLLARRHLRHHMSVGTATEAEHANFGGSPVWVCLLFVTNGLPAFAIDRIFHLGIAPAILAAFTIYLIVVEEIHWRIHLDEWLPRGLRFARQLHIAHHDVCDQCYNVFLPLCDWLCGTLRSRTCPPLSRP